MTKVNIFITILIAIQLAQVFATGRVSFDINRSYAVLNAGNCYIYPGVSTSSQRYGIRYYSLPFGWRQFHDKFVIPNLLSQRGDWSFGVKATDDTEASNEQFRLSLNGLQIQISFVAGSGSRNLVIGSNFRTNGLSDQDYNSYLNSLSVGTYFNGYAPYWYPGKV
jgi:hypothetical protein